MAKHILNQIGHAYKDTHSKKSSKKSDESKEDPKEEALESPALEAAEDKKPAPFKKK